MEIVFAEPALALIESDAAGETGLPVAVIKTVRRKLTLLRAVETSGSLRSWKSLQYEEVEESRGTRRSIRISDRFRLVFGLREETPLTATILRIEDYH
jgi:toxin HigB-1